MHTAEEVREVAEIAATGLAYKDIAPMLLAYADLLEAMEKHDAAIGGSKWVAALRQRAAEKQKARKG